MAAVDAPVEIATRPRSPFAGLPAAVRFLTLIPVPGRVAGASGDLDLALPWFTVVGVGLGAITAAADAAFRLVFATGVASALDVVLLLALSGAIHADGLMDTADGVLGHATPKRRLEIMRDPRVGSFGAVTLASVLLLKVTALAATPAGVRPAALLLAPALGRWGIVLVARWFPYGRPTGMGAPVKAAATPGIALLGTVPMLLGTLVALPWALALMALGAMATFLLGRFFLSRLPGLTGDCYGATSEILEMLTLLLAAPLATALR